MGQNEIDLEKQPMMTATATEISPSPTPTKRDSLFVYQTLVGDVHAKGSRDDDSLYHTIMARQRQVKTWYWLTAVGFGVMVLAQIVLCLGIAIGAQIGLSMNAISILAGVNTGVAAAIAVLKGLQLPDKKGIELHKLEQLAENIRFTTRKIKAGLDVDAAKEAEDALKVQKQVEDDTMITNTVGDAAALVKAQGDKKE